MEQAKENKMGTAPMFPLILSMAVPAMFSMLVQALYNVVDSIFVSHYDPINGLSAVSLAFPVQTMMIALAVGTGVGLNSLISRRLGEGHQDQANAAATHGLLLGIVEWGIFAILGGLFSSGFYQIFSNNAALIKMAGDYTWVVTVFSIGIFLELNIEKILQATGDMIHPMFFLLTGAVINIVLDPIFIFGYFGLPAMGVAGAAVATVIGQISSMLLALYVIFFKEHQVKVNLWRFRPQWRIIRDIYLVGVPSIVMQSIAAFLTAFLNMILIRFSESAVAVLGIYFKLQSFIFMPVFGLNSGVMPVMGYSYGARNKKRLMEALWVGMMIAAVIMGIGTALFWCMPNHLLSIFSPSDEMREIGVVALRTIGICFVPAAGNILFSTLFQGVGMGGRSLLVSVLRQIVIILPVALWMAQYGVNYVWVSFSIAEVVALIISIILCIQLYYTHIRYLTPIK